MKKILNNLLCILIAVIIVFFCFFENMSSFYSDVEEISGEISTGSVEVDIENMRLENNQTVWTEETKNLNNGIIIINTSNIFSFTVKNIGRSAIDYTLDLQIAWNEEMNESGKLLVYPYDMDDETIFQNIKAGVFDNAIIDAEISDSKEIIMSTGTKLGINKTFDYASHAIKNSAKDYKFKIFFYEDSDISESPELYHNKKIEMNILVRADICGRTTNWAETENKFFSISSVIDTIYPVIREVANPKTFFITQTKDIDLTAYAIATDTFDGDITSDIIITSSPAFTPEKAGVYTINYNIKNSIGNSAAPLEITIVIWDFIKITSGYYHTLALTSHGKVYTWGYNAYGQLGDGTTTNKSIPQFIEGLNNIIDIAAGIGCSFALNADGQAYSWGRNENGRLGDNTTTGKNKPTKVAQPDGIKFIQISARFATAGGVTEEGNVYTWGYGGYGAAGSGKSSDIYAPAQINISNVMQLELGYYNGAAVTNDGKIYTWGSNTYGQLGTGAASSPGPNPITLIPYFSDENIKMAQVSVGYYHMAAVSEDGRLFTWGYGTEGRLGNGTTTNKYVPQPISMPTAVKKALAGYFHTGVLTEDGAVYFFGQNAYGKHGSGNTTNHLTPVKLESVGNVTDLSLAYDSSFVLSGSTDIYGMGYGGTGVLGTGNNNNSNIPTPWKFTPPIPK